MTRYTTLPKALALLTTLWLGACAGSGAKSERDVKDTTWIQPSPILAQQIKDEAARLPWTHGIDRLEQIRWFASAGEPAYPTLLQLATDPRDDVAAAALAALGATMDRRLVPSIRELPWDASRMSGDLSLERARALLRLGDWSEIPVLIQALRDERVYTRSLALDALKESTHQTMDFDPRGTDEARETAVQHWERWWEERSHDAALPQSN